MAPTHINYVLIGTLSRVCTIRFLHQYYDDDTHTPKQYKHLGHLFFSIFFVSTSHHILHLLLLSFIFLSHSACGVMYMNLYYAYLIKGLLCFLFGIFPYNCHRIPVVHLTRVKTKTLQFYPINYFGKKFQKKINRTSDNPTRKLPLIHMRICSALELRCYIFIFIMVIKSILGETNNASKDTHYMTNVQYYFLI